MSMRIRLSFWNQTRLSSWNQATASCSLNIFGCKAANAFWQSMECPYFSPTSTWGSMSVSTVTPKTPMTYKSHSLKDLRRPRHGKFILQAVQLQSFSCRLCIPRSHLKRNNKNKPVGCRGVDSDCYKSPTSPSSGLMDVMEGWLT